MSNAELLSRFNVFKSSDVFETEVVLSRTLCPHTLTTHTNKSLGTVQNLAKLERSEFIYVRYGIPVRIFEARVDDCYLLIMPQRGFGTITIDGTEVSNAPGCGAIVPAGQTFYIDTDREASGLIWRINRRALENCARLVTGLDFDGVIEFEPGIRLDQGATSALGRAVHFVTSELNREEGLFQSIPALDRFEQSLMHALIDLQPSNIRDRGRRQVSLAPKCVRRVEEYINTHAGEATQMADLIRISGVCGRTLYRTFRQFRQISPIEYLRRTRLQLARQSLMRPRDGETVTDILTSRGITQFGRFAGEYRRCYGELPSQTLNAARDCLPIFGEDVS